MRSMRPQDWHWRVFLPIMVLSCLLSCMGPRIASCQAVAGQEETAEIKGLGQCGLVTRYASSQIGDNCLQEALNVYLDEDMGISRRGGYAKYNASALPDAKSVRGLWPFRATDGTDYMVVLSSQTMFQSNGQGAFTAIPGLVGLSATQDMDCTQCLGKLWCVNGSDTMFNWDGASTSPVTTAPTCAAIDCFRNRVVMANCSGTLSQLRLSGELDGTDYSIPTIAVSTSPATISVGGTNDGNKLTGVLGTYQDVLVLGKTDSLWGLYGFDRRDFTVREISREVGAVDNRSAREKQGSLYWLSKRGIEKMTGPSISRVSDPVRDLIDTIIVAGGNSRGAQDTTQANFEAGNLTASGAGAPMSAAISPGNVVASTWSGVDISSANFLLGTLVNVSTNNNTIVLSKLFENTGFEYGNETNWTFSNNPSNPRHDIDVWGRYAFGNGYGDGNYFASGCGGGVYFPTAQVFFSVNILNAANDSVVKSLQFLNQAYAQARYDIDVSTFAFPIKIHLETFLYAASAGTAYSVGFSTEDVNGNISFFFQGASAGTQCNGISLGGGQLFRYTIDFIDPWYVHSGTFTSRAFDTGFSTPIAGPFDTKITSLAYSLDIMTVRSSSNGANWGAYYDQVLGATISAPTNRYYQYRHNLIASTSAWSGYPPQYTTPIVHGATLTASTTGYFISQCKNPGASITSWGLFQCNHKLNDGSLTYYISTGASCGEATRTTSTWNTQVNNSVIGIATAPYVAYRVLFDLDSATETPTLNDCTINWNEGTTRPSVSAEVYRDRYYLSYTSGTSGTIANDHIAVLDSRDQWVIHDAPNCSTLGMYNRKMYCGDSTASGRVYLTDTGHDDDGADFTSTVKFKDFNLGNPYQKKILKKMYYDLAGLPDPGYSINLTPSYTLDASTDTFALPSIGLNEDYSRFIAAKVPASLDNNTTGRWLSFGLTNTGSQGPWKLFGLKFNFIRLPED